MKIGIFSDVHGNLPALEKVIEELEREKADKVFCLGDVVGCGPDIKGCFDLIKSKDVHLIRGNHEEHAVGDYSTIPLNSSGILSTQAARQQLTDEYFDFIRGLPKKYTAEDGTYKMVHFTGIAPENFFFLRGKNDAGLFDAPNQIVCFAGHTHRPAVFKLDMGKKRVTTNYVEQNFFEETLNLQSKYIINVGSVGYSRDSNSNSSFAVYDDNAKVVRIQRVKLVR